VARSAMAEVGDGLATLFGAGSAGGLPDDELIRRYREGDRAGSERSFAAIVDRHGGTVLGACRRVTGDAHLADDAFQATFLVLARRARSGREVGPLGAWLRGVAVRVSFRAWTADLGRRRRLRGLDGIDPPAPPGAIDRPERAELLAAIEAEVARLPRAYRAAFLMCRVEGVSPAEASRRLRCPLGTIQSRLHRARRKIRAGLDRRGLAPAGAGLVVALRAVRAGAAVDPSLLGATLRLVGSNRGRAIGGMVPPGVASLADGWIRRIAMRHVGWVAATMIGLAVVAGGSGPGQDRRLSPIAAGPEDEGSDRERPKPGPSLRDQVDALMDEWRRSEVGYIAGLSSGGLRANESVIARAAANWGANATSCARRLLDLAETSPADPAARKAMLFAGSHGWASRAGPFGEQMDRAVDMILRFQGDDDRAARFGLNIATHPPSRHLDRLLAGLARSATRRESKGLALQALAVGLETKAIWADKVRGSKGRFTVSYTTKGVRGRPMRIESPPLFDEAYEAHLRSCDPASLRSQASRHDEAVLAGYADVVHSRLEPGMPPDLIWNRGLSLGAEAAGCLDAMHGLVEGGPAPKIEGVGPDGKTSRLGDLCGKVAVVVCWRAAGEDTSRELAHLGELAARMNGRPFALITINGDPDEDAARRALGDVPRPGTAWRDAAVVGPWGRSPIRRFPSATVIDATGTIRFVGGHTLLLDALIDGLVAEAEKHR